MKRTVKYIRDGRKVYQITGARGGFASAKHCIATCKSELGAALTIRQLYLTKSGKLGCWRKYMNR